MMNDELHYLSLKGHTEGMNEAGKRVTDVMSLCE